MNAVPFDTLKLARGLEAAGLAAPVAAGAQGKIAAASTELNTMITAVAARHRSA